MFDASTFANAEEGFAGDFPGEAVLGFGKHRNKSLKELAENQPDYLRWVLSADFSADIKAIITDALAGKFPGQCVATRTGLIDDRQE